MDKLKVGIIGTGSISGSHLQGYLSSGMAQVSAVCDPNQELAAAVARTYGIPRVYADYREMLRCEELDCVSVCTPTFTHKPIVIDALRAGAHVLCEKPPALYADEVRDMMEAAAQAGRLLMFGFVLRFSPKIQYMKHWIDAGELGGIYYANARRLVRCDYTQGWFGDREKAGGGMLFDGAIHELDAALYLMGYPRPVSALGSMSRVNIELPQKVRGVAVGYQASDSVRAPLTIESVARGFVTFENGASLVVEGCRSLHTETKVDLELVGDKGGAYIPSFEGDIQIRCCQNDYLMDNRPVLTQEVDMHQEEIHHFLACCRGEAVCRCPAEHGLADLEIIEAIYRSAREGKAVYWGP